MRYFGNREKRAAIQLINKIHLETPKSSPQMKQVEKEHKVEGFNETSVGNQTFNLISFLIYRS